MIESISIRKCASFDDNGITINDLQKVNFIYGVNGSGKTTISNFIEDQADPDFNDCELKRKSKQPQRFLVYNKRFRENNFGSGEIEGVFTLGQATKKHIESIKQKQDDLEKSKDEGIKKKNALEKLEQEKKDEEERFKEAAWESVYKKHKGDFKEAFKGTSQKKKLLSEFDNNTISLLSYEVLKTKAETIFGTPPESISLIGDISYTRITEIESEQIWTRKIIGKSDVDIAGLIQRLDINDWVNQGRAYLQEDTICPFCQKPTITDEFKKQLEAYFDESFAQAIRKIDSLSEEYSQLTQNLINILTAIETKEKGTQGILLDVDKYSGFLKTISSQFSENRGILNNKIKEPSRSAELILTKSQIGYIEELIKQANKKIEKHNNIVANFQEEKRELVGSIWKYVSEEYQVEIRKYNKKTTGLQTGIKSLEKGLSEKRKEYTDLKNEIVELNKDVTSVQPTIDEINNSLRSYGFLNFVIVPSKGKENYYQIEREDGTLAGSTLSEGEITFITFLYFMQLAKGSTDKDTITDERVIVMDDPISSLDSNVLFLISTLIKSVARDIRNDNGNVKQLIVLTHNVYFHKEVSFIDGRTNERNDTYYWILRKNNKISSIQPYQKKNPIKNSYELLWQEIKNKEHNSGVTIQNTMRRIIENYFKILGKYGDDDLIKKFETKEDQEICRSLICWINDGSHSIVDDLYIEVQDGIIDKYLDVFKRIFSLTNHEGHFNMMMGIEA